LKSLAATTVVPEPANGLKKRLSQRSLGEAIGQDQAYISRLEQGRITNVTVDTLEKLADVLEVSTDYLLGRVAEPDADLRSEPAALVG
jgi:transcriptional regulator with XRE-family HTH domain